MSGADLRPAIRAFFDGAVREWDVDRYRDETYRGRARIALRWLRRGGAGKRVLDVGCGTGHQTVAALRAGDRVVSTDFSFEMARATRNRVVRELPGVRPAVVVADAMHLPFRPGSFDAAVALGLVGFVPDRPRLFRELHALLRPGGQLACDVALPQERVLFHALGAAADGAARWARRVLLRRPAPAPAGETGWYGQHFVKHTPAEIESILAAAGLRPMARGGAGFGELRLGGRAVLPWRVETALARALGALSVLPGGGTLARHALTYVVRSVRPADPAPLPLPPRPAERIAHAPALRRQLRQ